MRGILRTGRVAISFFALTALGALPHCSASEEAAESGDALVDLPETSVKSQAIGNCWAYTTAGWIESMRKDNGTDGGDVAEIYWSYWWWFEQIHDANRKDSYPFVGTVLGRKPYEAIYEGARFGTAFELILRFGLIEEKDFLPGRDGSKERAERLEKALKVMDTSLKSGRLKTEAGRADPKLVRAELNRAFDLSPRIVKLLNDAFGEAEPARLDDGRRLPDGSPIQRAKDVKVKVLGRVHTLDELLGARGDDADDRRGEDAWTMVRFPCAKEGEPTPTQVKLDGDRRKFLRKIQRTLHAGTPVPIAWWVDSNVETEKGEYVTARHRAETVELGTPGSHASLIDDYDAIAPTYGSLPAGSRERSSEAREDALDDRAQIRFFRIKNSWGMNSAIERGYNDLYLSYLSDAIYNPAHLPIAPTDRCDPQTNFRAAMLPRSISGTE